MIITPQHFEKGSLKMPNVTPDPNGSDYIDDLQSVIDEKEREILIDGLGFELYTTLSNEYADLDNASQEIKDLVNGKSYTLDGMKVRYEGLTPLLSNYIYYHFLNDKTDVFSTMGIERPDAINSMSVSSLQRGAKAYIKFLEAYQGGDAEPKIFHTRNGWGIDYYGSRSSIRSLYDFLNDNRADYPTAKNFIIHEPMNSFNI